VVVFEGKRERRRERKEGEQRRNVETFDRGKMNKSKARLLSLSLPKNQGVVDGNGELYVPEVARAGSPGEAAGDAAVCCLRRWKKRR